MWKLKAAIDLVAMNNGLFLVKFASVDDYDYAKYGGPCLIFITTLLFVRGNLISILPKIASKVSSFGLESHVFP